MVEYTDRESRQKYISEQFSDYLPGSILNIGGGGKKFLLKYVKPKEYLELDISGEPDLLVDLDKEYPLPIADNRFDTVICTEVLEHLDQLHRVFLELLRISNKYIIISVPNAWRGFNNYIKRVEYNGDSGRAGIDVGKYKKFYGLPLNKPVDRHKWFFSYTEAEYFFKENTKETNFKVIDIPPIGIDGISLKGKIIRKLFKALFGDDALKDWFCDVYWCVLEKSNAK